MFCGISVISLESSSIIFMPNDVTSEQKKKCLCAKVGISKMSQFEQISPLMQSYKEGLFQHLTLGTAPYTACSWSLQPAAIWQCLLQSKNK